ncbi:hypothetical protein PC122_g18171, partial [Phytophthora cactorum]
RSLLRTSLRRFHQHYPSRIPSLFPLNTS